MTGRPRDPKLETKLLAAAWSLLTEHGYDALTLTKVATEAGAHRSDVYRRWSTKVQLVVDVFAEHLPPVPQVDTGSLLGDIRSYVGSLADSWASPWMDGVIGALADLRYDPDAELAFLALGESRGQVMRDTLDRAVTRGEIAALPDRGLVGDLLEGPLMHRRMISRQPLSEEFLDGVAAIAYRVVTASMVTP